MNLDTEDYDRGESKRQYETLLGTIEKNTGGKQPATMSRSSLLGSLTSSGGFSLQTARSKLRAAKENGDVKEWQGRVFLTDEASLVAIIKEQRELIMRCNTLMQEANDA